MISRVSVSSEVCNVCTFQHIQQPSEGITYSLSSAFVFNQNSLLIEVSVQDSPSTITCASLQGSM